MEGVINPHLSSIFVARATSVREIGLGVAIFNVLRRRTAQYVEQRRANRTRDGVQLALAAENS